MLHDVIPALWTVLNLGCTKPLIKMTSSNDPSWHNTDRHHEHSIQLLMGNLSEQNLVPCLLIIIPWLQLFMLLLKYLLTDTSWHIYTLTSKLLCIVMIRINLSQSRLPLTPRPAVSATPGYVNERSWNQTVNQSDHWVTATWALLQFQPIVVKTDHMYQSMQAGWDSFLSRIERSSKVLSSSHHESEACTKLASNQNQNIFFF